MNYRSVTWIALFAFYTSANSAIVLGQAGALMPSEEIKVFRVTNVDPDAAIQLLSSLFRTNQGGAGTGPRIAFDKRTGALIVKGSKESHEVVAQVLQAIDVKQVHEAKGDKKSRLSFYRLKHASAMNLQELIAKSVSGSLVQFEPNTNSLIVEVSNEADETKAKDMIELFDQPRRIEWSDVSVRIVWLVDKSLTTEGADAVPADLASPIEALRKKLSLGELRLASQSVVHCSASRQSRFSTAGTVKLNAPYTIEFQGAVSHRHTTSYELQISGSARNPESNAVSCSLETMCSDAMAGQPIIIGTTSLESKPSVFVLQIMEN